MILQGTEYLAVSFKRYKELAKAENNKKEVSPMGKKTEKEIIEWKKQHRKRLLKRRAEVQTYISQARKKLPKWKMTNPGLFDDISQAKECLAYINKRLKEPLKERKR